MKKVKVKFLQSIASAVVAYKPGDEAMIEAQLAEAWEASGTVVILKNAKE